MKDDILTAITTTDQHVAPIAPLPSRLSFCVGPNRPELPVPFLDFSLTLLQDLKMKLMG